MSANIVTFMAHQCAIRHRVARSCELLSSCSSYSSVACVIIILPCRIMLQVKKEKEKKSGKLLKL